jgi:Nuclease A inhibitor-like protein
MSDEEYDSQVASVGSKSVNDVVTMLQDAASGLLFTSESDYAITIFQLPTESSTTQTISVENAKTIFLSTTIMPSNIDSIHRRDWMTSITVEETSLDWVFRRYTEVQDWWEQSHLAELPKWKHLESIIKEAMFDVLVFRIGQASDYGLHGSIDVFIIGRCKIDPSTWVGLHTISVET